MPSGPKKPKKGTLKKGKSTNPKSEASDNFERSAVPSGRTAEVEEWDEYEEATEVSQVSAVEKGNPIFTSVPDDGYNEEHAAKDDTFEEHMGENGEYEEFMAEENEKDVDDNVEYEEYVDENVEYEDYAAEGRKYEEQEDVDNAYEELAAEYDEDFNEGSIEEPPPTPIMEESFSEVAKPNDLEIALKLALERLDNVPMVEFLQSLSKQADVHAQAITSAKEIANDFVAKSADLAEAMHMILQYDQLMLRKLDLTTAYDFGVKPKTDEETRAVMIDRAQKMLDLGQLQYEKSHQISDAARPLVNYRFEACDDVNAVKEKLTAIEEKESAKKEALAAKEAQESGEQEEEQNSEHPEDESKEKAEGSTELGGEHQDSEPSNKNSNAYLMEP